MRTTHRMYPYLALQVPSTWHHSIMLHGVCMSLRMLCMIFVTVPHAYLADKLVHEVPLQ